MENNKDSQLIIGCKTEHLASDFELLVVTWLITGKLLQVNNI